MHAIKFTNGLAGFVTAPDDPEKLKVLVQTLRLGHLHFDVTAPRAVIFCDAIMDLFCAAVFAERSGNHDCAAITRIYGLHDKCKRPCIIKTWKQLNDVFKTSVVCGLIDERIVCM